MKKIRQIIILLAAVAAISCSSFNKVDVMETRYVASDKPCVMLYSFDKKAGSVSVVDSIVRGTMVEAVVNDSIKSDEKVFVALLRNGGKVYADKACLTSDSSAVVMEKVLFVRTPASVISDTLTSKICGQTMKGTQVDVIGFDYLHADGTVHRYKVRTGKSAGYVYGKYLVASKEEALARYMPEKYDSIHNAARDRFGAGKPIECDFFPRHKPVFADNVMPEACYSLYINSSPVNLAKIDEYIALAKSTRINTFVIDIKDCECPGYKAEAMKEYSPTNYRRAAKRGEKLYHDAVRKLHDEGFYVVGRITCFKDTYFVNDNPSCAITEIKTGEPFWHNKSYWPSAYDRRVWEFNVALAKESIRKFGFNEINFDYVRFPDKMMGVEGDINYHNTYGESKIQTIQRFVQYAVDEIHELGAYVSIDVFGESANMGYTTPYGQYWPAMSNIADVMCGMPYPDHFPDLSYGVSKPWNHPYEILYKWGERVNGRQAATPSPAKVRTWVQAYHVMRHIDANGIDYNAENIEKEIRALYAAGLRDGYTTWLSSSNLDKYTEKAAAFRIDYLAESE